MLMFSHPQVRINNQGCRDRTIHLIFKFQQSGRINAENVKNFARGNLIEFKNQNLGHLIS